MPAQKSTSQSQRTHNPPSKGTEKNSPFNAKSFRSQEEQGTVQGNIKSPPTQPFGACGGWVEESYVYFVVE